MKKFSKSWYRLEAYAVVGRAEGREGGDARIIVTKSNINKALGILRTFGFAVAHYYEMGKIETLGASQAREVNTFVPDYF